MTARSATRPARSVGSAIGGAFSAAINALIGVTDLFFGLLQRVVGIRGMAYVFVSERSSPISDRTIRHIVLRAGQEAGLPFPIHPHMPRHACGFYLANKGVDTRSIQHYLGHRNIQHTVRYTELAPHRFDGFWDD